MTVEPQTIAALLSAFAETPQRLLALENSVVALKESLSAIQAAMPPALATIPEAAAAWKVSAGTMRRWAKQGRVPTVKVAGTVRVDLARFHGTDDLEIARRARGARERGTP